MPAGRFHHLSATSTLRCLLAAAVVTSMVSCDEGRTAAENGEAFGSLGGRVRLIGGSMPTATGIKNSTDPEACGQHHTLDDLAVSPRNRGVRDVILSVRGVPAAKVPESPPQTLKIDNSDCRFEPHASVATLGSTLLAINSDAVLHTTHLYGPTEDNVALPFAGSRATMELDRAGLIVVKCDVHGWMQAFVRVDSHPFHAVTDEDGSFRIERISPGDYVLEVWHERLGAKELEVRVAAGRTNIVDVGYSTDGDEER